MTDYHNVNMTLSDLQLEELKSAAKNATGVILRLSSDMIGADENNFLYNLSNTQLSKITQSSGFLGRLIVPLLIVGLPLKKNVLKPLAKCVLISLRLIALVSAVAAGVPKNARVWNSELVIPNEEMKDIMKQISPSKTLAY